MESQYIYQLVSLILLILVAVFAFWLPSRRSQKKMKNELETLHQNETVVTKNGLTGKIVQVKDDTVIIAVKPDNIRLEIAKWGIKETQV